MPTCAAMSLKVGTGGKLPRGFLAEVAACEGGATGTGTLRGPCACATVVIGIRPTMRRSRIEDWDKNTTLADLDINKRFFLRTVTSPFNTAIQYFYKTETGIKSIPPLQ